MKEAYAVTVDQYFEGVDIGPFILCVTEDEAMAKRIANVLNGLGAKEWDYKLCQYIIQKFTTTFTPNKSPENDIDKHFRVMKFFMPTNFQEDVFPDLEGIRYFIKDREDNKEEYCQ